MAIRHFGQSRKEKALWVVTVSRKNRGCCPDEGFHRIAARERSDSGQHAQEISKRYNEGFGVEFKITIYFFPFPIANGVRDQLLQPRHGEANTFQQRYSLENKMGSFSSKPEIENGGVDCVTAECCTNAEQATDDLINVDGLR